MSRVAYAYLVTNIARAVGSRRGGRDLLAATIGRCSPKTSTLVGRLASRDTWPREPVPCLWRRALAADHVPRGIDVGRRRAEVGVHRDSSPLAGSNASGVQIQVGLFAQTSGTDQNAVGKQLRAARKREHDVARLGDVAVGDFLVPVESHAVGRHRAGQGAGEFTVEERKQLVCPSTRCVSTPIAANVQAPVAGEGESGPGAGGGPAQPPTTLGRL